jgi:hypothetical protein
MKKLSGWLIAAFLFVQATAQEQQEIKNREYYLEKSKNQKTTAWLLAGSGAALTTAGIIGMLNNTEALGAGGNVEAILMVGGIPVALSSLILFSMAEKSKEKAGTVVVPVLQPVHLYGTVSKPIPGIGIRIRL